MTNLREILSRYWRGDYPAEEAILKAMKEACDSTVDECGKALTIKNIDDLDEEKLNILEVKRKIK